MRYAHTCYRVLDLERSLAFYCDTLGFDLQRKAPIREEAINAFVAPPGSPDQPLELTFNFDRHRDDPYEIGDGYGHVALYVEDLDGTLARLAELGVEPEKPPYMVSTSRLCFVRDPDGYRIELIERA
jgi:lactoylglutathione lyase